MGEAASRSEFTGFGLIGRCLRTVTSQRVWPRVWLVMLLEDQDDLGEYFDESTTLYFALP